MYLDFFFYNIEQVCVKIWCSLITKIIFQFDYFVKLVRLWPLVLFLKL